MPFCSLAGHAAVPRSRSSGRSRSSFYSRSGHCQFLLVLDEKAGCARSSHACGSTLPSHAVHITSAFTLANENTCWVGGPCTGSFAGCWTSQVALEVADGPKVIARRVPYDGWLACLFGSLVRHIAAVDCVPSGDRVPLTEFAGLTFLYPRSVCVRVSPR